MQDSESLAGRIVLVTGAGSGLGAALCAQLGADGARVAALDIDPRRASEVVERLGADGAEAAAFAGDVGVAADGSRVLEGVLARFGGLSMQRKVMFDVLLYRKHRALYRERIRGGPPWFYLLVTASLIAAVALPPAGRPVAGALAAALWLALSLGFFFHRLRGTSARPRNVGDLLLTSLFIPPLSIFWRLVGVFRFGWGMP